MVRLVLAIAGGCLVAACSSTPTGRSADAERDRDVAPGLTDDDRGVARALDEAARAWDTLSVARNHGGNGERGCISCHTTLPYLLVRHAVRAPGEPEAPLERTIFAYVEERVGRWQTVSSWYDAETFEPDGYFRPDEIAAQSRATEAILNAVILSLRDARLGRTELSAVARRAFDNLWALQIAAGPAKGAFPWLDMTLPPWESPEARYWGAALVAVAVGSAPKGYARESKIRPHVAQLAQYLRDGAASGTLSLHNQAALLWASGSLAELLDAAAVRRVQATLFGAQRPDGSWRLVDLSAWKGRDKPPPPPFAYPGDGYATGLVLVGLLASGVPRDDTRIAKAIAWLKATKLPAGGWRFTGPPLGRRKHLFEFGPRLLSDASTGFATLALYEWTRRKP